MNVGSGYKKSMKQCPVNVGTDEHPIYEYRNVYPAFPWRIEEEEDHRNDDPKEAWDMFQTIGDVPLNEKGEGR